MSFTIRQAMPTDEPVLWQMIFEAAHMAEEGHTSVQAAKERLDLARYVQDWGRSSDIGVVAVEPEQHQSVGAAWARLLIGDDKGYGYVDDETPELAIGVLPSYRGKGVGSALLARLLEIAKEVYPAMSLSTRADNLPAVRLYEQMNFQKVAGSDVVNWAGGVSYNMLVRFAGSSEEK
jgi:ribosomal protein S18 acetylase RimI-like enzyme